MNLDIERDDMKTLMSCGHAANATDSRTKMPVCAICNCYTFMKMPDLSQRYSKCLYCNDVQLSNPNLPFFEYKAKEDLDGHSCGCRGWG